jgi:hypothetical protein
LKLLIPSVGLNQLEWLPTANLSPNACGEKVVFSRPSRMGVDDEQAAAATCHNVCSKPSVAPLPSFFFALFRPTHSPVASPCFGCILF